MGCTKAPESLRGRCGPFNAQTAEVELQYSIMNSLIWFYEKKQRRLDQWSNLITND
jgi:hypothetical protein